MERMMIIPRQDGFISDHTLFKLLLAVIFAASFFTLRFMWLYYKARAQFPGPPVKNFWVGNLDQTMADDVHEKWNGPFSRIIYVGDPQVIAKISTTNWPKSSLQYDGFRPLSGDALFTQVNHERWQVQRKRLAPAFQPQVIDAQYPCFSKHLEEFIQQLDTVARNGTVVDLSSLNIRLTLDFIGDIAYGANLKAVAQGPDCRILRLFEMVLPELMKCGLFPMRGKFAVLKKTRDMYRAIRELRNAAKEAVEHVRGGTDDANGDCSKAQSKKIFEILAQQREPGGNFTFSTKELCDNYVAFLVAGGDPTAHTMSFLIYEVLQRPEILRQVQAEVDASIPSGVVVPSLDQVRLPYLSMVLKETLRYHSTGFGTFRTCPVDTKVAGVRLPANTTLALWNPAVHRDPRLWEDADSFNPDRWRPGGHVKAPGTYFPFSYGPRNCLGQGLAMFEMKLTLATLFRRYNLSLEPGFKMTILPSFTLRPKHGLPLLVTRRDS